MRPVDPRVLPHLRAGGAPLAVVVLAGTAQGLLVLAQAVATAGLVTRLVADPGGRAWTGHLAAVVALGLAVAATGWARDVAAARAAARVVTHLRSVVLDAAGRLAPAERDAAGTASLTVLATRGAAAVEPYLTRYLPAMVSSLVLPPAALLLIAVHDVPAALVVLATLPLLPLFAALVGLETRDRAAREWRALAGLSGHFLDVVRGLPTLVAYGRATHQSGRIRAVTHRYREATLATLRLAFASSLVLELAATLSVALVAVTVGLRLAAGHVAFADALVVLLLAPEAYWPLRRVGQEFHAAAEGTATFEEIHALTTRAGASPAGPAPAPRDTPAPLRLRGLAVGRGEAPVLAGLDADLAPHGLTVVVGPSGCGKSTLLAVLGGELAPLAGTLTWGEGSGPRAGEPATLDQTPWLRAGTLADNLRLGDPAAADADLWSALREVRLDGLVAGLPDRLETRLGDDGLGLSAGQRARLGLARVLLAAPHRGLVVLDEPTAHLDAETEQVLLTGLRLLADRVPVVAVAHRDAVVAIADAVLDLTPYAVQGEAAALPALPARPALGAPQRPAAPGAATPAAAAPVAGPTVDPATARRRGRGGDALGAAATTAGVALTATSGWLITRASEQPPVLYLLVAIVGVRLFGLARPVLRYAERLVGHDAALRLLAERRAAVYDVLVPLVPARLGRRRGDLLTSVVDDVDAELDQRLRVRPPVLSWVAVTALTGLVALAVSPGLAAVLVTLLVLPGGAALLVGVRSGERAEEAFVAARARLGAEVHTALVDAQPLAVWRATDAQRDRVEAAGRDLAGAVRRGGVGHASARACVPVLTALLLPAVAPVTARLIDTDALAPAWGAAVLLLPLALLEVTAPLADVGGARARFRRAQARLAALAATRPAVTEPARPAHLDAVEDVRLWGVRAGWTEDRLDTPAVDLEVARGGRVALVGPSGSGKSTVAAVLLRFLAPRTGAHLLGGADAGRLGPTEVRRHTALVDDDPWLFASTLRENLRLARPGCPDDDLVAALGTAGLGGWLAGLGEGLDTPLGEGHRGVSGGERARLGIARALLSRAEVVVLDEPTAHLDHATAAAVVDAVLTATADRALVWITHTTEALDRMDHVLRLEAAAEPPARAAAPLRG